MGKPLKCVCPGGEKISFTRGWREMENYPCEGS